MTHVATSSCDVRVMWSHSCPKHCMAIDCTGVNYARLPTLLVQELNACTQGGAMREYTDVLHVTPDFGFCNFAIYH